MSEQNNEAGSLSLKKQIQEIEKVFAKNAQNINRLECQIKSVQHQMLLSMNLMKKIQQLIERNEAEVLPSSSCSYKLFQEEISKTQSISQQLGQKTNFTKAFSSQQMKEDISKKFHLIQQSLYEIQSTIEPLRQRKKLLPFLHQHLENRSYQSFSTVEQLSSFIIHKSGSHGRYENFIGAEPLTIGNEYIFKIKNSRVTDNHAYVGVSSLYALEESNSFMHEETLCYRFYNGNIHQYGNILSKDISVRSSQILLMKVNLIEWFVQWQVNGKQVAKTSIQEKMHEEPLYFFSTMYGNCDELLILF